MSTGGWFGFSKACSSECADGPVSYMSVSANALAICKPDAKAPGNLVVRNRPAGGGPPVALLCSDRTFQIGRKIPIPEAVAPYQLIACHFRQTKATAGALHLSANAQDDPIFALPLEELAQNGAPAAGEHSRVPLWFGGHRALCALQKLFFRRPELSSKECGFFGSEGEL